MTEKSWPWSTVAALGDGSVELGESDSRLFLATRFLVQDPAVEGVSKGVLNELAVSGIASPLTVASGSGVCYGLYINDAPVNVAVSTPAVGTTGGRIVLQTNWAGTGGAGLEARTRVALKMSADGNATPPGLTQSVGTTWEVSLATFTITTGGVITVTDARTFRRSTGVVQSSDITDLNVNTADIANDAVTDAKLRNSAALSVIGRSANSTGDPADIAAGSDAQVLRRSGTTLGFGQVATAGLADNAVDNTKIRDGSALSVIGRSANSTGDPADIAAGVDGYVLRRSGTTLGFGQVATAGIADLAVSSAKLAADSVIAGKIADGAVDVTASLANDIVDDTKVGNRVPQFYRRQGGSASAWATTGTTNYTPTTVRMQGGVATISIGSGTTGILDVTFPQAFSNTPLVLVSMEEQVTSPPWRVMTVATSTTTTGFRLFFERDTDPGVGQSNHAVWLAIGPE